MKEELVEKGVKNTMEEKTESFFEGITTVQVKSLIRRMPFFQKFKFCGRSVELKINTITLFDFYSNDKQHHFDVGLSYNYLNNSGDESYGHTSISLEIFDIQGNCYIDNKDKELWFKFLTKHNGLKKIDNKTYLQSLAENITNEYNEKTTALNSEIAEITKEYNNRIKTINTIKAETKLD